MDKVGMTRDYILDMLERGGLDVGDKLPGARELCGEVDASFVMVQTALSSLMRDGILESVARRGTFVREGWRERVLSDSMVVYKTNWPWLPGLRGILAEELPELRLRTQFHRGVFELRTTIAAQRDRTEYLDLSKIFKELYPGGEEFFSKPFEPFYGADGSLHGIPFIFSPRVMFYNPRLLRQAGCELPRSGWSWDDFLASVRILKKSLPGREIFNWDHNTYNWMSVIFRAGGCLIDPSSPDVVKLDDVRTREGLLLYTELGRELGVTGDFRRMEQFSDGNLAFMLAPREELNRLKAARFNDWGTVSLPLIPGGTERTTQATDLLCVRRDCGDMRMAREFIRVMLSERVQDYIGGQGYGIPVRKSSAMKSIDFEDERDSLFMTEMSKMSAEYNLSSPQLAEMIECGIRSIWTDNGDIGKVCSRLAEAVRTFIHFRAADVYGKVVNF